MINHDEELDTNGLKCPMPLLKTKKALALLDKNKVLKISATDKNAVKDLQAFCDYTDHEFIAHQELDNNNIFLIYIKKG
jgi:tRNA 2-thiouridine synthesizing protein A